jgi:hypothetical protein
MQQQDRRTIATDNGMDTDTVHVEPLRPKTREMPGIEFCAGGYWLGAGVLCCENTKQKPGAAKQTPTIEVEEGVGL